MSYAEVVTAASRTLEAAGWTPSESRRDATLLARVLAGWDRAQWILHLEEPAPPAFIDRLRASITRRATHEPVAYIVGEREFYGRAFAVSADVLVPRPETEGIVEEALAGIGTPEAGLDVIDVGTGSGCLAITLALECAKLRVVATDISARALAVARINAERLGAAARVSFRHVSLTGGVTAAADLVVANPPYVALRDRLALPPDVRDHEPAEALFGGPDGLDAIRALLPDAARALRPGGHLVVEFGMGQAEAVRTLAEAAGFVWRRTRHDLADIARVMTLATVERSPILGA